MKNFIIFLISSLFLVFSLFAQDQRCDTLFLANGKKVPLQIDSFNDGRIFGKSCDHQVERFLVIRGEKVDAIKQNDGGMLWDIPQESAEFASLLKLESTEQQGWIFNQKSGNRQLVIPKTNQISVKYMTLRGKKTSYGKLISLNGHELALETKRKGVLKIPTERISKISLQKKAGWLGQLLGSIGVIVTILLTIGAIIAGIFLASFSLALFASTGEYQEQKPGCAYIIPVLLIASIVAIILSLPKTISDPFAGDWEVTGPKVALYEEIPVDQP